MDTCLHRNDRKKRYFSVWHRKRQEMSSYGYIYLINPKILFDFAEFLISYALET